VNAEPATRANSFGVTCERSSNLARVQRKSWHIALPSRILCTRKQGPCRRRPQAFDREVASIPPAISIANRRTPAPPICRSFHGIWQLPPGDRGLTYSTVDASRFIRQLEESIAVKMRSSGGVCASTAGRNERHDQTRTNGSARCIGAHDGRAEAGRLATGFCARTVARFRGRGER
jgi:hypothetical protein